MLQVDLRSDTFTQPSPGMLEAMYTAKTGDDVFGEDPTVIALEQKAARLFGMESALYCVSGTMSNQIAIKAHTQPGDEVICDHSAHVYLYEAGGIAANAGCQVKLLAGDHGRITAAQLAQAINPDDIHQPPSRLVSLENTANKGGGSCYDFEEIKRIRKVCDERGLLLHLDGARLFNALIAQNETAEQYGNAFDSISICLNKGLGCPIGSILLGSRTYIHKARRIRKRFGGGLRQAGYMAATGIYALEHHINRLAEDHRHAALVAAAIQQKEFCRYLFPVATNIVLFETAAFTSAREIVERFAGLGIRTIAMSPTQVRLVFHLDISPEQVNWVLQGIQQL